MSETPWLGSVTEHFDEYLRAFKFWPTEDEQRMAGTDEAFRLHAVSGWDKWPPARRAIAADQWTYKMTGIDAGPIDGLVGPQTEYAREAYAYWQEHGELPTWRDEVDAAPPPTDTKLPTNSIFPKQSDMGSFYGTPGPEISRQLVRVRCPWTLRIAWDLKQTTTSISIHRKCADSLEAVLAAVWDCYGERTIKELRLNLYGGSYNHRRMRGGSSWSTHAYGAAIDWDPAHNALNTTAPAASLSGSEYEDWWRIWQAAGWLSLGRARNFDWMHVQAALL